MTKEFKPTYLYIKRHTVTGLLYFGKTNRSEKTLLEEYNGSGLYWQYHLKEHGCQVDTIWYCLFTEKEEIEKFSLMCSDQWDIVNARGTNGKKIWGNLLYENGLYGNGNGGVNKGIRHKKHKPHKNKGIKLGPQSEEHRAKNKAAQKGISRNKGIKRPSQSERNKGNSYGKANKGVKQEIVKCPYCLKDGGISNMKRWHFDNCSKRKEVRCSK